MNGNKERSAGLKRILRVFVIVLTAFFLVNFSVEAGAAPIDLRNGWNQGVDWEALYILNVLRVDEGLNPVSAFFDLDQAAKERSEEIAQLFSHTRPDGSACFTILDEYEVEWTIAGENIAAGYDTPEAVMAGWYASDGHRANMLNGGFRHVGTGFNRVEGDGYNNYWTQLFIGACSAQSIWVEAADDEIVFSTGTTLEEIAHSFRYRIVGRCEQHGEFQLPLLARLCTGYDETLIGEQEVGLICYGISTTFTVTLQEGKPFLLGDVNEDGLIDTADAALLLRYSVGLDVYINFDAADFNGDGYINTGDAAKILRFTVGL